MEILVLVISLLTAALIGFLAYCAGRTTGMREGEERAKQMRPPETKDEMFLKTEIQNLLNRIDGLDELNSRYLSFMVNVSTIVQRLNVSLDSADVFSSICRLVLDLIPADAVELYTFDVSDNRLRLAHASGGTRDGQVSYALGEGLVGKAAQDSLVKIRDHNGRRYNDEKDAAQADSKLWMTAPITFGGHLFGVIGIGRVENQVGNERNLLKIIADIAGVVLLNRSIVKEAKQEADTDVLTGLRNRRYFYKVAYESVEKSIREGDSPVTVFLFDMDNFKHYNDTNGHDEGDKLLRQISELIRESTRKSCTAARFGGEEFIVLLPGQPKEGAFVYADRLREKISQYPFAHREKQPLGRVSVSGGIACFPQDGRSITEVIRLADSALYRAKSEGKNRVVVYTPPAKGPS